MIKFERKFKLVKCVSVESRSVSEGNQKGSNKSILYGESPANKGEVGRQWRGISMTRGTKPSPVLMPILQPHSVKMLVNVFLQ